MDNKIGVYKIVNTGNENDVKFWDGAEVFFHVFNPIIICSVINLICEKVFLSKWGNFVPAVTYILLLLGISTSIMRYRKKSNGKFKLSEVDMIEIVKVVLAMNSSYFFCAGLKDNLGNSFVMAATNISLYLGFAISLEQLLVAQSWKDITKCFLKVLPKKQFALIMLIACVLFGGIGFYSDKIVVFIGMLIILGIVILLSIILYVWRLNLINLMCKSLLSTCCQKRMLFLHAGSNKAILTKVEKEITFFEEIDSLKGCENKYDIVVVLDTSYGEDKKEVVLDSIKMAFKKDGIIVYPFVGKHKKRNRFYAWLGVPKYRTEFDSIEEFLKIY